MAHAPATPSPRPRAPTSPAVYGYQSPVGQTLALAGGLRNLAARGGTAFGWGPRFTGVRRGAGRTIQGGQDRAFQLQQRRFQQGVQQQMLGLFGALSRQLGGPAGLDFDIGKVRRRRFPRITQGGLFGPEMVERRVGAIRQRAQQEAGGTARRAAQSLAGRGFAPLAGALGAIARTKAAGQAATQEEEFRRTVARLNAEHLLRTQMAGVERGRVMEEARLGRKRLGLQAATAMLPLQAALLRTMGSFAGSFG